MNFSSISNMSTREATMPKCLHTNLSSHINDMITCHIAALPSISASSMITSTVMAAPIFRYLTTRSKF